MFPFWLVLGLLLVLLGIFNRQVSRLLGIKPMSQMFTIPGLLQSSRVIEKIGQWLVITLGVSFLVQGLDGALPDDLGFKISVSMLGLIGLMILVMIGITIANWKAK